MTKIIPLQLFPLWMILMNDSVAGAFHLRVGERGCFRMSSSTGEEPWALFHGWFTEINRAVVYIWTGNCEEQMVLHDTTYSQTIPLSIKASFSSHSEEPRMYYLYFHSLWSQSSSLLCFCASLGCFYFIGLFVAVHFFYRSFWRGTE